MNTLSPLHSEILLGQEVTSPKMVATTWNKYGMRSHADF